MRAAINGKFYAAGGFKRPGSYVVRKLHGYDPLTNSWSEKALMPGAVQSAAWARFLGQPYVLGRENSNHVAKSLVQAYDPVANAWAM